MQIAMVLNGVAVASGIAAGLLWFRASVIIKSPPEQGFSAGLAVGLPKGKTMDFLATAQAQSKLNAWAAAAASVAAFAQAASILV